MRKPRSLNNDLTGQQFTRWTVVCKAEVPGAKGSQWHCRCSCGTERIVSLSNLRAGMSRSCGCLHSELLSKRRKTHGESRTKSPEYSMWKNMKNRCYDTSNAQYQDYGGRGVTVCDRWKDSFENFLVDVGRRPSPKYSIDRINNNGNYEPGNVRWATKTEQNSNKRNSRLVEFNGETKTVAAWARHFGFNSDLLYYRLFKVGMPFEKAISTPLRMGKRLKP